MAVNRIKEVLKEKLTEDITPSKEVLQELNVHRNSWTKWVNKTADPEFYQVPIIASFLCCSIEDLFPLEIDKTVTKKHGLIS